MSTIRILHKNKFTTLSNELAQNNKLSLRSRGLMLYLLSLPDDWTIHVTHLVKTMIEGRKSILASLAELKKLGYVHLEKLGFDKGWTYFVFEEPTNEEEFKLYLRTKPKGNSSFKEQFPKEQLQKTKEEIQKTNLTTKQTDGRSNFIKLRERVKLTQKQYDDLIKEHGKEATDWILDKLNTYKTTKNQTYRSDIQPIKRWVIAAWRNAINKDKADNEIKEKNTKVIKEIQNELERKQKRGILTVSRDEAIDTVLGKSCNLNNPNLPKFVASWYGWEWEA